MVVVLILQMLAQQCLRIKTFDASENSVKYQDKLSKAKC